MFAPQTNSIHSLLFFDNKLYSIFFFVCIVAFVWNTLCRSCDIAGTQGEVGKGKISLSECKKLCEQEINCIGIDYGKGPRLQECYLNLGIYEMHVAHNDFDVYIVSRQDVKEEKHPLRSNIYKYIFLYDCIINNTIVFFCR